MKKLSAAEAACYPTNNTLCFSTTISYPMTSTYLAKDSSGHADAMANLQLWSGLRNVPRCWEVIQPFLCAIYFPKCQATHDNNVSNSGGVEIFLPGRKMCDKTREPCKMVDLVAGWPEFMHCDKFTNDCNVKIVVIFVQNSMCHKLVTESESD